MKIKDAILATVIAVLTAGALAAGSAAFVFRSRVKALEAKIAQTEATHPVAVLAPGEEPKAKPAENPPAPEQKTSVAEMKVLSVEYNDQDELDLCLSERPDMSVVRQYVFAGPVEKGVAAFRYDTRYNSRTDSYDPHLIVTADFSRGTNLMLRVLKGFPVFGKTSTSNLVVTPLAADFTYDFRRKDAPQEVKFAARGRYLPSAGGRAIAVESVNVEALRAEVRSVPSANIVQILSLEEGRYNKIHKWTWPNDGEWLEDVSSRPSVSVVKTANRLNERETTAVPVCAGEGSPSNGVFLVMVRSNDIERNDRNYWWSDEKKPLNPNRYRLVCITDLGLSIRRTGASVLVWVTSLTKGVPVAGAKVEVFSTAGVLLGTSTSGSDGLCTVAVPEGDEPFAVVASAGDGSDRSFVALEGSMKVDETVLSSGRDDYLPKDGATAFAWTERGIYRHCERIFFQAILRNGQGLAPAPFPVELRLCDPEGDVVAKRILTPSDDGSVTCDELSVAEEQPSGTWEFVLATPGENGCILGTREVKIEEFAPPHIRVKVQPKSAADVQNPRDFAFTVSAEHLYGGPAAALKVEGAVVFEDAAFAPAGWSGYKFGDDGRGLKPNFRRLDATKLDASGKAEFRAPIWADSGKPRAAVKAIAEGSVFEDGGRPATARTTVFSHYYPFYIGSPVGGMIRLPESGFPSVSLACVDTAGKRLDAPRRLVAKVERIESVYAYKKRDDGTMSWDCEHVRSLVAEGIELETSASDDTILKLPVRSSGDYALTVVDPESDVSFGTTFYVGDCEDTSVRAALSNPVKVGLVADKKFYRVGEVPRFVVKSPFPGTALVTVLREGVVYSEVVDLPNATGEIALRPVEREWAPNVDVSVSVIQSATGGRHLAARAHGEATVVVRPSEREIGVSVEPSYDVESNHVAAKVRADGASCVTVTLVDEGINILTDEKVPDPISRFAEARTAERPFYDLYHRILPVVGDDILKASGIKTGGGAGAELLGRVSPVPTRRFRPLALWQASVPVVDGEACVDFALPEFVGEVRVTAVAWSDVASGASASRCKVAPRLVCEPDAPRFVAPCDEFELTLPVANMSGERGSFAAEITLGGATVCSERGEIAAGETRIVRCRAKAPSEPGEAEVRYVVSGCGESHESTILLPVRPAVAWRETAGVEVLSPGASWSLPDGKVKYSVAGSRLGELKKAIDWLAEYPHGCLEQTSSRIFPLISAGGILNAVASDGEQGAGMADFVAAGVARVESMIRSRDFVMWPDCSYAPWDCEVSLYAAHFLIEAEKGGATLHDGTKRKVTEFLTRWALSSTNSISAYACHTLALAGSPDKDRMLRLYDERAKLDLLSRARLARAFAATADRRRACELVANAESPADVREAAFLVLALLDLDPDDPRLAGLVSYILDNRDKELSCWGTTAENAHALLAVGEYYRHHPPRRGEPRVVNRGGKLVNEGTGDAFVSWRRLVLPAADEVREERSDIELVRTFLDADGNAVDLSNLSRGAMLVVELTLKSSVSRDYADIVVEDLFAGAFEPVRSSLDPSLYPWVALRSAGRKAGEWVMRSDARDDRMLVFTKKFHMEAGDEVRFHYPVRVVTAGGFALPCAAAEAMYQPRLRARTGAGRVVVRD